MNSIFKFSVFLLALSLTYSCFEDDDDTAIESSEISDFVWKGMNFIYLYKDNIPDLLDDRFTSDTEYRKFLNGFDSPENLFESLIYQRELADRFSWITTNYIELEQQFSGVTKTTGAEYNFYYAPGSSTNVFGIVRLVQPNSDASSTPLVRGHIFNKIDGVTLTEANLRSLLNPDTYTVHLATYNTNGTAAPDDDSLTESTETITLTKTVFSENPIFKTEIITLNTKKVGYLMYNGFVADYDAELNAVFGDFKAQNIEHLVLDLRYNPGGSVNTAITLGSMITGISNKVFARLQYNNDLERFNTNYNFTTTLSDDTPIYSLGLSKVYVITTGSSASASEMVINSLKPYIDVVQIGTNTNGKAQASVTIYDSPDFQREGANPNHLYALQPLVASTVNTDYLGVPFNGLTPDIEIRENVTNFGVLGDSNEPLLAAALAAIQSGRFAIDTQGITPIMDSNTFKLHSKTMYID
ncbi:MAG: S41 family peptidase [Flavobacteriaceae bacterium]|nr:S41 family peptidase [Flavobacteriaceae bacterium]